MALLGDYPWALAPLIICPPMRLIARASLAVAISQAGGLGFLAAGYDLSDLDTNFQEAKELIDKGPLRDDDLSTLPIGVGFINWGANQEIAIRAIQKFKPAAVWFFAPRENADLISWTVQVRESTEGKTKIWVQCGSVRDSVEIARLCSPDVLVLEGYDAGGHGLQHSASIISLLPEVSDALNEAGFGNIHLVAAGGIADGRGVAACLALGASGIVMGSRFLASTEASIAKGYQNDILRSKDGGITTARTKVYDILRGTTGWPEQIDGRGIINDSFLDARNGEVTEENRKAYAKALTMGDQGWGQKGRLTAYAGTAIGLINSVKPAKDILEEVRKVANQIRFGLALEQSKL